MSALAYNTRKNKIESLILSQSEEESQSTSSSSSSTPDEATVAATQPLPVATETENIIMGDQIDDPNAEDVPKGDNIIRRKDP